MQKNISFKGYRGENCDKRSIIAIMGKHKLKIIIILISLLLTATLVSGFIFLKRTGRLVVRLIKNFFDMELFIFRRLQSIPTVPLPTNVRTTLNNIRNFITRSTDSINIVRFRNARSNTTSNTLTMVNRIIIKYDFS